MFISHLHSVGEPEDDETSADTSDAHHGSGGPPTATFAHRSGVTISQTVSTVKVRIDKN
jgi:hypothetical protein